jgi:uncharacterized HhH-GPD family protein
VFVGLVLSQNPDADALLDREPLALLIGMVLDQQFPLERAFSAPYELTQRMGEPLDAERIATYDTEALTRLFAERPALHRYPRAMAERVQQVCRAIVDRYGGDTAALWRDVADGRELLSRLLALPGFGQQKAQIFVALLGKQYQVQPPGWREAAGPYGPEGIHRSAADITDDRSRVQVREYKAQLKAAAKAGPGAAPEGGREAGPGAGPGASAAGATAQRKGKR